jgi:hypothetical protein
MSVPSFIRLFEVRNEHENSGPKQSYHNFVFGVRHQKLHFQCYRRASARLSEESRLDRGGVDFKLPEGAASLRQRLNGVNERPGS